MTAEHRNGPLFDSGSDSRSLLTESVRVLNTSDLLALMHVIVTEFQRRWAEAEDG